jgi:hypothetical protein
MVAGIGRLWLRVRTGQEASTHKRKAQTRRKAAYRGKLHGSAPFYLIYRKMQQANIAAPNAPVFGAGMVTDRR